MKKRLFSALLVLVMAVSVFSVTAFADNTATYSETKTVKNGLTALENYSCAINVTITGIPDDGKMEAGNYINIGEPTQSVAELFSIPLTANPGASITSVTGSVSILGVIGEVPLVPQTKSIVLENNGSGNYSYDMPTNWSIPQVKAVSIMMTHTCVYDENKAVTVPASCEKDGSITNFCIYCGHKEVTVIDALRHKLVDVSAKEPTCLEGGYSAHQKCSRCDYTEGYKAVDALGHDWGEWTVADNGSHERVCQREGCNAVDSHAAQLEKVEGEPATCTEKGLTDGEKCSVEGCTIVTKEQNEIDALGHKWGDWKDDGNGTHSRVCANDRAHVETVRHTAVTDPAVAATCTEDGKTEGSHCSVCDAVIKAQEKIPAIGHKYGEWADTKDGKNHQRVCANDPSHVETEKHEFGDWIVTVEATQTTDGSAYHVCKACGYKETAKIPAGNTKPQTGDESNALLYAVLMLTAVTGVVVTTGYAKKKAE